MNSLSSIISGVPFTGVNVSLRGASALFALTGDHYGLRYFNSKPSLYELSAVPFILYGQNITGDLMDTNVVGTHADVLPTIVEDQLWKLSNGGAVQYWQPDHSQILNLEDVAEQDVLNTLLYGFERQMGLA